MTFKQRETNRERGQAAVMVTLGITFLLGILGLVVDVGYSYFLKQIAQAAADSAVLAAVTAAKASGKYCGGDDNRCQTGYSCPANPSNSTNPGIACLYASANGGQNITITEGTGVPASGIASSQYWINVTSSQSWSVGFLSIIGAHTGTVSASATAALTGGPGAGGCIYVLNPTLGQAMTVSGGSSFIQSDCGVYVDSNASNALSVTGGATIKAGVVNVVGGASTSGGSTITPTANANAPVAADPLANLPAPTFTSCDHTSFTVSSATATLDPGVYCGGITITGTSNVTFNPGTYILNGGGFTSSSSGTTLSGIGVTFYNTNAGYTFKPVTLSGGTSVTLSAPTSGTYEGILFFQDRNITSSAKNTISGGSTSNLSGSIYMPTAQLVFSGGSTSGPLTLAIVVDTFTVSGASYLKQDTTGNLTGMGSTQVALIQ